MRRFIVGFTLMELLVVIAIAATLAGIAIPSFKAMTESAQRRATATDFYSALTRARSEAIARNSSVSVCARSASAPDAPACVSSSNWQGGWIIYSGSTATSPLLVREAIANGFTLTGVVSPLVFDASGRIGTPVDYQLCKGAGDSQPRRIRVSRSGRVSLELGGTCS